MARFATYLHEEGHEVSFALPGRRANVGALDFAPASRRKFRDVLNSTQRDDVIVVPEILSGLPQLEAFPGRIVLLNQNPFLTGAMDVSDVAYSSPRTAGVLATSRYTVEYLSRRYPRLRIERVVLGVAPPRTTRREVGPGRIAWMPRKRIDDAQLVLAALVNHLDRAVWSFDALDGLAPESVQEKLNAAALFLAFGEREGFGLPVAEAMACGTPCVGFTGVGGNEILTSETGWPVPESDVVQFIDTVRAVCSMIDRNDPEIRRRSRAGADLITSTFTPIEERRTFLAGFRRLTERDGHPI